MGMLDNLENMAMSKVAGSNPEAAAVMQMIENHPGGIGGLVQSFHNNGMSGLVNSWISTGANQPATGSQVQQALGSEQVQAIAQKLGVSPEMASGVVAQFLPMIIDKLSPNGEAPNQASLMSLGAGLLSSLGHPKS